MGVIYNPLLTRRLPPKGALPQNLLRARFGVPTLAQILGDASITMAAPTLSSAGVVTVSQDGADSVYVPLSSADFTKLGLTVPDSLWLAQEASGNLSDSIGAVTLTANATPTYQQSVTNWTRKGVGMTQASAQRFTVGSGTYNPFTSSSAILVYFRSISAAGVRFVWTLGSPSGNTLYMRLNGGGQLGINCIAQITNGTYNFHEDVVHPALFVYNRTAGTVKIYTDEEQITGTYGSGVTDGNKGIGTSSGTSFNGYALWACQWYGAGAEAVDTKTVLSTLGWSLAY